MNHHPRRSILPGQRNGLPVTVMGEAPGLGIDGTGKQFIEGGVEHPSVNALQLRPHCGVCPREVLVHIASCAVFGNFQAQAVLPCVFLGIGIDGGKVQFSFFHPHASNRVFIIPYLVISRSSFPSKGLLNSSMVKAQARACLKL